MSRAATTAGTTRLLHCSPDRTLFRTVDPESGDRIVCKVFVRGSLTDAQRELTLGQMVAELCVVQYLRAEVDALTNRPCLIAKLHQGVDLERLVASQGAPSAARATALLLPVARTLAAMHALRSASAPQGLCHGDVKPKNLLVENATTRLLDFEHARAIGSSRDHAGFTGGTFDFAPPEARLGRAPDAAFDTYGLGATLRWLLCGGNAILPPLDPDLDRLLRACLAADPRQRPAASTIAEALAELTERLADDPVELATAALRAGDLERTRKLRAQHPELDSHRAITSLAARCERLLRAQPHLLVTPEAIPTDPTDVHRELRHAQRVLRRFPSHAGMLGWRAQLLDAASDLIAGAAEHISRLCRAEEFDSGMRWLDAMEVLLETGQRLPGGIPLPPCDDVRAAGLLHRAPLEFLRGQRQVLDAAREELAAEAAAITAAEDRLDLPAAELAIDAMARRHGGTSPTAARRRDQLHRFAFYLQRVARAQKNVEQLGHLWDRVALAPLLDLVARSAKAAAGVHHEDRSQSPVGLRSLQITLVNLVEEFPHLAPQVDPALEALSHALEHTTDQCWTMLAEAHAKLQTVPVPVRPLQLSIGRLDTFRMLEAFVDRPERARSSLLDGIESLRLALEQARATRDRLTQGAEQALARGHWTTGLFDMERAVAGLNPGDEHDREEEQRLRDRLAEAKRRKREVEAAVRRNVELASRYGLMQDEAGSTYQTRLQVLAERRDCLMFLAMHLPAERGVLYSRDLREVETLIAQEQAGVAEQEFDGAQDPATRLRIARTTLDQLGTSSSSSDFDKEVPGRMQRLLEHWRTLAAQCQRELEREHSERAARARQRRRMVAIAIGAAIVSFSAIGFAVRPWLFGTSLGNQVSAATRADRSDADVRTIADLVADPAQAIARLTKAAEQVPPDLASIAPRLLDAVRATQHDPFAVAGWHTEFAAALLEVPANAATTTSLPADAWRTGLALAVARCNSGDCATLADATATLAPRLAEHGIRLGIPFAELQRAARPSTTK